MSWYKVVVSYWDNEADKQSYVIDDPRGREASSESSAKSSAEQSFRMGNVLLENGDVMSVDEALSEGKISSIGSIVVEHEILDSWGDRVRVNNWPSALVGETVYRFKSTTFG